MGISSGDAGLIFFFQARSCRRHHETAWAVGVRRGPTAAVLREAAVYSTLESGEMSLLGLGETRIVLPLNGRRRRRRTAEG